MDILQSNLKREKPYRGKQEDKRSLATVCKIMEGIERKFDLYLKHISLQSTLWINFYNKIGNYFYQKAIFSWRIPSCFGIKV